MIATFSLSFLGNQTSDVEASQSKLGNYEKYWVQYSEDGNLLFRYITQNNEKNCPSISVDDKKFRSSERQNKYEKEFPIKICQQVIQNSSKPHTIRYKSMNIKTKIDNIGKISVVGDTGCITDNGLEQSCKAKNEYPFFKVAQSIKNGSPDLIIHVGDYFYSKTKCEKNKDCFNRSFGDNFESWKVDFLNAGSQFFNSAPIIFTRGNHESCERGGKGWAVLLHPSENFKECEKHNNPYTIETNNLRFLILDSAYAIDSESLSKKQTDEEYNKLLDSYKKDFNKLAEKIDDKKQNIMVVHKALYSKEQRKYLIDEIYDLNYMLHEAMTKSDFKFKLPELDIVLSGHTHTALLLDLEIDSASKKRMYQIVSGNGGAKLYQQDLFINENSEEYTNNSDDSQAVIDTKRVFNAKIKSVYRYKGFGYSNLNISKDGKVESVSFHDQKGVELTKKPLNFEK